MEKIKMPVPIAELDGDEMTHILWGMIKDQLITPFVELNTEYYDLSLPNRDKTEDAVTRQAAEAIKRLHVGVKCATITPNYQRQEEYGLKQLWKSPNATIRAALDGPVDYEAGFTQLVEQSANKYLRHFVFYCCGRAVALLLGNPSDFDEYLHILADEICQLADRALGRSATVGVSREFARFSDLNDAYKQAIEALRAAADGEGGVSFTADARKTGSLCERALEIIEQHYMDEDLSLASLSAMLDVSPNHLSACIKKSEGETFINILVRRRMETAQTLLLTTDLQIQEIARRCGYTDQHYFSYCFKKYSGTSPVALRRARAAGEARS